MYCIIHISHNDLPEFHSTALSSIDDATASPHSAALQTENSFCVIMLKVNDSNLVPEHREENSVNPVSRRLADISKAKKLLGYDPQFTLEQGLKELSQWYFEKVKETATV